MRSTMRSTRWRARTRAATSPPNGSARPRLSTGHMPEAEAFDAARMLECRADEASAEAEEVWTLDDRNKIAGGRR